MEKKNCHQCNESFTPQRNSKQSYCSKLSCQSARKNAWRKQKHQSDPDYRENHQRAQQKWLKKNPDYWRKYRDSHLEYSQRNRAETRRRKQQRSQPVQQDPPLQFAKSDAFNEKIPIKSGHYRLIPVGAAKFAKSDALTVEISLIT